MLAVRYLIIFVMLVLMSNNSSARETPNRTTSDTNVVDLVILRDGNVIATPKLVMRIGTTAVVTVAKHDGYSIKSALGRDSRIANGRKLDIELFFADDGRWKSAGKPSISVVLNGSGRLMWRDEAGSNLEIRAAITDMPSDTIGTRS